MSAVVTFNIIMIYYASSSRYIMKIFKCIENPAGGDKMYVFLYIII